MHHGDRIKLDEAVVVRAEQFGALAYSYRDRRLLFIAPELLPFLASEGTRSVGEIASHLRAEGKLDARSERRILLLLEGLRQKGIVHAL